VFKSGDLIRWLYLDAIYLGVIIQDLGVKSITKKYLIYWLEDATIIECFEADIEKVY